jgi:hypothetical protein
MTAKIIPFPVRRLRPAPIRLTREVLIPGLVTYDYDDPSRAHLEAVTAYRQQQISRRTLEWVREQIAARIAATLKRDRLIYMEASGK